MPIVGELCWELRTTSFHKKCGYCGTVVAPQLMRAIFEWFTHDDDASKHSWRVKEWWCLDHPIGTIPAMPACRP